MERLVGLKDARKNKKMVNRLLNGDAVDLWTAAGNDEIM